MKKAIKILLFIPFVALALLFLTVDVTVGLVKALLTAKGPLPLFEWVCDLYHTDKIKRWWTHRYKVIHREEAIKMGLKFHSNIYGDLINMYDCRSLWEDDKGRRYRVHELEKQ
jgi:hypothetical protein